MLHRFTLLLTALLPGAAFALGIEDTRHLLARTGFGATPPAAAALTEFDRASAVQQLLAAARDAAVTPAPAWAGEAPPDPRNVRALDEAARRALQQRVRAQALELKGWWYQEMLATDSPLTERMVLFWHNHFTSSTRKVRWPAYLYQQNALLRRHALGNFRELLHAVARDPAMLVYLDNHLNRRGKPNENFARELLELFTLGVPIGAGQYSEQDIKEAARAFSGWTIDRRRGTFLFNRAQHDDGIKTFLGRSGRFDGDAILDILLAQPRTAEHITEKLWREFVSAEPDAAEVRRLAAHLRVRDYAIQPLLAELFATAAFWAPGARGTLVKSPAELMVGSLRALQLSPETGPLVRAGRQLGQDLFDPPNVKGWPSGNAWITSSTLLARQQFLQRTLRGPELAGVGDDYLRQLVPLLTVVPAVETPPADGVATANVRALMLDPAYQLK
jgi:uncharacterized protein (DUF1800 family)